MPKKYHHKLVRDLTPAVIRANGDTCACRQPEDDDERLKLLIDKLVEEALELQSEYERTNEVSVAELADVSDVHDRLFDVLPPETLALYDETRIIKQNARGLFEGDVILTWTEEIESGRCDVCQNFTKHKDLVTLCWRCLDCVPL